MIKCFDYMIIVTLTMKYKIQGDCKHHWLFSRKGHSLAVTKEGALPQQMRTLAALEESLDQHQ